MNRLDTPFGELFKEQFYKVKYKTAETIFPYLGAINVRKGLNLNYFATWFTKSKMYYNFIETIKASIKKSRQGKNVD